MEIFQSCGRAKSKFKGTLMFGVLNILGGSGHSTESGGFCCASYTNVGSKILQETIILFCMQYVSM